ncbi:MAG: hypothetical protein NTY69_01210 [Methylococcales bacterium]|nr:hypothetical protein [Methylococcales bacterium]
MTDSNKGKEDILNRTNNGNGYGDPQQKYNDENRFNLFLEKEKNDIGIKLNNLTLALVIVGLLNVDPFYYTNLVHYIEEISMFNEKFGLILNFIGALLLGLSTQFGVNFGWSGQLNWKINVWKYTNALGWFLLSLGFFIQLK